MNKKTRLKFYKFSRHAKEPQKASSGAAGLDLFASEETIIPGAVAAKKNVSIGHGLVSTGIGVEIPHECVGRIGSRSGLSLKYNIEVGAGWIDPDYRGEVKVELKNFGPKKFIVKRGMRIAQLMILKIANVETYLVNSQTPTKRGARGFGSTGL